MRMLSAPVFVFLGITGKCNLRCRHCHTKETWDGEDLSAARLFDAIDQLGKARVFNVALFGGEPLVRRDLFDIVDKLNEYPFALSMNTNATLMDAKTARELVRRKVRSFTVSLDGTAEVHERQRGSGTFRRTIAGIRAIIAAGGSVSLNVVVTKLNIGDLENIVALGRELGVKDVGFNHVFHGGNALCHHDDIFIPPHETIAACRRVHGLSRKYRGFVKGSYVTQHALLEAARKGKPGNEPVLTVPPCGAATETCAIRPDGWVVPCSTLWEKKAGRIGRKSFGDIWKNSAVMKEFRAPMSVDISTLEGCPGCNYRQICFTGHRCAPYCYPEGIGNRELYCLKKDNYR